MADEIHSELTYTLKPHPSVESKLRQQFETFQRNLKFNPNFGPATRQVRDFSSEMERANQRVITLGASFAVLSTSIRTLKDIVKSTIEVEKAFTEINAVFGLGAKQLDTFSKQLFDTARNTAQSFDKAAAAAKEFSRQGLSAEETIKRTRDALMLTRLAKLDVAAAVDTLTASINGFQKSALTSTAIVNKLATVDAAFAVSSKDLAEGLARAGAAASDAGVSFDQLIGLITSAQQTTARGGAVIGNSLKTIFTRIEQRDTIEAFEGLGVAVRDAQGNMLSALPLLQNFAKTYDTLTGSVKKQAAEMVGGVFQINILKALLGDLAKANGIAASATMTSVGATDEAIKRNEALNKSLDSMLTKFGVTAKQVGANIGSLSFAGPAKALLGVLNDNPILKMLEDASGKAETAGGKIAQGLFKGLGGALVFGLGPMIMTAIARVAKGTMTNLMRDFGDITKLVGAGREQQMIQQDIVALYRAGGAALQGQLATMTEMNAQAALLARLLGTTGRTNAPTMAPLVMRAGYRRSPRAAGGYIPMAEEAAAISMGVGGAPVGARPVYLPGFNRGGGARGIVANTSEWITPHFAGGGSAIYNRDMIQRHGLPPGSKPVAAGGFIPYVAGGLVSDTIAETLRTSSSVYARQYAGVNTTENFQRELGKLIRKGFDISKLNLNAPESELRKSVREVIVKSLQIDENLINNPKVRAALTKTTTAVIETQANRIEYYRALQKQPPYPMSSWAPARVNTGGGQFDPETGFETDKRYQARMAAMRRTGGPGSIIESRSPSGRPYVLPQQSWFSRVRGDPTYAPSAIAANKVLQELGLTRLPSFVPPPLPAIARPHWTKRMQTMFGGGRGQNAALAASFAFPAAGAMIPSGVGGTTSGMALGALGSGLTTAGFGASAGLMFGGGPGAAIGAGSGLLLGGISGALSKITKSFEELAAEIQENNSRLGAKVSAINEVFQLDEDARNARTSGQPKERIYEIQLQQRAALARLDPGTRAMLQARFRNPEAQTQALGMVGAEGAKTRLADELFSSVLGASETQSLLFNTGYTGKDVKRVVGGLDPILGRMSSAELTRLKIQNIQNPTEAMRQIGAASGMTPETRNEFMSRQRAVDMLSKWGNVIAPALPPVLSAILLKGLNSSKEQLAKLYSTSIDQAITKAREMQADKGATKTEQDRAAAEIDSKRARALASDLGLLAQLIQISAGGDIRETQTRQGIALNNPRLTDMGRLGLSGQYEQANIATEFRTAKEAKALVTQQQLIGILRSSGGYTKAADAEIAQLTGAGSMRSLRERLGQPGTPIPSGKTEQLIQVLDEATNAMEILNATEAVQIRVSEETNRLRMDEMQFYKTYRGARAQYSGAAMNESIGLADAFRRGEVPDAILQRTVSTNMKGLEDEYNLRVKGRNPMSSREYYGRRMGIETNADAASRINAESAALYALGTKNQDITGNQAQSGLFAGAKQRGLQGNVSGSFAGGFRSVIAGVKQDLLDFSEVGARVADDFHSAFTDSWTSWVTDAKRGKEAFREFAVSVLSDASRMLASKAFAGVLSAIPGFAPAGATGGEFMGTHFRFARGGMVPAMLTGDEIYIGPSTARQIGYDKLRQINSGRQGFAQGGDVAVVRGGSGEKDDVPANLPRGAFIIRKGVAQTLGPDYFRALAAGQVQSRFWGGALIGGLLGGGIGYAVGGKRGALAGATLGAVGGGLYSAAGNSGSMVTGASGPLSIGANGAASSASGITLSMGQKAFVGMAGATGLGALAGAINRGGGDTQGDTAASVSRSQLESQQSKLFAENAGRHAYMSMNSSGGYSLDGFGGGTAVNGGPVYIKVDVNNNGGATTASSSSQGDPFGAGSGARLQRVIRGWVKEELVNQRRSDGFLTQQSRYA